MVCTFGHLFAFGVSVLTMTACAVSTAKCKYGTLSVCKCTTNSSDLLLMTANCADVALLHVPNLTQAEVPPINGKFVYNLSRNWITTLTKTDFWWLIGKNISVIDLSNNRISFIPEDMFQGITAQQLNIASNAIFSLSCEAFQGFRTNALILSDNTIVDPCTFCKCLASAGDRLLIDLRRNAISSIGAGCFNLESSVELSVDMSQNNVSVFHENGVANSSVIFIDVGNNSLSDSGLTGLVSMLSNRLRAHQRCTLGLTHNRIQSIASVCNRSLNLDFLLDHNDISEIPSGCWHLLLQSNASVAKLSYNVLRKIPEKFSQGLDNVTELHLDNNNLSSVAAGAFDNLTSMTLLNLSRNSLTTTESAIFSSLCFRPSNLKVLDLSYNDIISIPPNCFEKYTALSILNLSGNKLISVSKEAFAPYLNVLLLRGNSIGFVLPGAFVKLHSLRTLDISSNKLTDLLAGDYNMTMQCMFFSGNPFNCSCALVLRLADIAGKTDFDTTQCVIDGQSQRMSDYLTDSCTYFRSTASPTSSTASAVGIVIAVVIGLCLGGIAYFAFRRRETLFANCVSSSQYKAMDDGDPSFADAQGYKFVSKPDRLQLIT